MTELIWYCIWHISLHVMKCPWHMFVLGVCVIMNVCVCVCVWERERERARERERWGGGDRERELAHMFTAITRDSSCFEKCDEKLLVFVQSWSRSQAEDGEGERNQEDQCNDDGHQVRDLQVWRHTQRIPAVSTFPWWSYTTGKATTHAHFLSPLQPPTFVQ